MEGLVHARTPAEDGCEDGIDVFFRDCGCESHCSQYPSPHCRRHAQIAFTPTDYWGDRSRSNLVGGDICRSCRSTFSSL